MINDKKIGRNGFMKTLGSLWCLCMTIFATHLAWLLERNSYALGYHKRQLNSINQSFPICKRNQTIKDLHSYLIPDGWCRSLLSFPTSA